MIRTRFLVALGLAALILFVASTVMLGDSLASANVPSAGKNCAEDEPCFVWSTMGNLERGVVVRNSKRAIHVGRKHPNGRRLHRVVTACQFAYLSHEGLIDRKRTPRLRGDKWAEVHGCDYDYYG